MSGANSSEYTTESKTKEYMSTKYTYMQGKSCQGNCFEGDIGVLYWITGGISKF